VKITDSANDSPQLVGFGGMGLTPEKAVLSPSNLGFGRIPFGTTSPPQAVTLSNPGTAPLAISSIYIYDPSFAQTNNCPATLAPGTACTISVTFTPMRVGLGYMFVADSATYSPQIVYMVGQASGTAGTPGATVLPAAINFGYRILGTTSLAQTITLTNSGTSDANITSVAILSGKDMADFTITRNGCLTSYLKHGESCQIQINFTAAVVGSRTALLSIINVSLGLSRDAALSGTGVANLNFDEGRLGDRHLVADFDRDGKPDYVVWRPVSGTWYVIPSSHPSAPIVQQWGLPGDIPVPGDYDGDGRLDYAVWRPSEGNWYIVPSNHPATLIVRQWGLSGDIPVTGDFDGDKKTDFAVWRQDNGVWYIIPSSDPHGPMEQQWGLPGDMPVVGDFDGDHKTDFAIWRPSSGMWFVLPTTNPAGPVIQQWGLPSDVPLTIDFDGDQKMDLTVWRPSDGFWYTIRSSNPATPIAQQWGLAGDVPM
jgi:hypothetical protein